jgi:ATP-dependent helicase HrpB
MGFDLERWRGPLPVAGAIPDVKRALADRDAAVLQAPPGAGKTTLVPLALLGERWLEGRRILMLEPRRLAARAAARRMAEMLGEEVGATVGYRTRLEARVGRGTRIEVLTEGILIRMIEDDPSLDGAGLVIFDEFHERSLDADLGLAFALDARRHLREDLRLLVMSATLDGASVAAMFDAPTIVCAGKIYDVTPIYLDRPDPRQFERAVAAAVLRALDESDGGILVFLPGGAEIRRVERLLRERELEGVLIAPLYGDLPQVRQDEALRPAPPGLRKIVLATSIAETSLTIEDIRIVVDGGFARMPRYEPATGLTSLVTARVSLASAEQRKGRAGRLGPGFCYRLWSEREEMHLEPYAPPEILQADLSQLALALAQWGDGDPASYRWLDAPPAAAYAEAQNLLRGLGALDAAGRITPHGKAMASLAMPPRLAHMVLRGKEWGLGGLAAEIAALLSERDIVKAEPEARDADLRLRLELMHERDAASLAPGMSLERGAVERVRRAARQYARLAGREGLGEGRIGEAGRLVAQAYPERVSQRRLGGAGQFRLAIGRGAFLPPADPLAGEEFLAVAHLGGERRSARIFLAAPIARAELESDLMSLIETVDQIAWDPRAEMVVARRMRRLGELVLSERPLADASPDNVMEALLGGIRSLGIECLPWRPSSRGLQARVLFLRRLEGGRWPDLSDAALLASLETWLAPFLAGVMRRSQFDSIDLDRALRSILSPECGRDLDRLAPTHVTVPTSSRIPIDYGNPERPSLSVRVQEMFGACETPAIAGGRVPLLIHLLSPAGRPLQVTTDILSFWTRSYPEVRRVMRGRYPRHPWPEDPLEAPPTARAKLRRAGPGR